MMKNNISFLIPLILTSFGFQVLFSQETKDSTSNSLEEGSWSLQFQISNNFTLSSFQGSNFSAKKHLSPNSALRFGIGLSIYSGNREDEINEYSFQNITKELEDEIKSTFVNINCYYIYYPSPRKPLNVYFGGGPLFSLTHNEDNSKSDEVEQDTILYKLDRKTEAQGWGIGAAGLIGVEWFLTKQISIHSEYGSSILYLKEERTSTEIWESSLYDPNREERKTKTDQIRFRSDNVKFGISVYF